MDDGSCCMILNILLAAALTVDLSPLQSLSKFVGFPRCVEVFE